MEKPPWISDGNLPVFDEVFRAVQRTLREANLP
jgi:hypothetical protein